jgi:nucleotide-binding universal stress UspA family protein
MRVLLPTNGSCGDVQPLVALDCMCGRSAGGPAVGGRPISASGLKDLGCRSRRSVPRCARLPSVARRLRPPPHARADASADGRDGRDAVRNAVPIAKWPRAAVTVLHVAPIAPVAAYVTGSGLPPYMSLTSPERGALLASMKGFAAIDADAGVALECEVAEGDAATAILAWADDMPADLLVLRRTDDRDSSGCCWAPSPRRYCARPRARS